MLLELKLFDLFFENVLMKLYKKNCIGCVKNPLVICYLKVISIDHTLEDICVSMCAK